MKDEKLQKLINKTIAALISYQKLEKQLEKEYYRRFGCTASDIDDSGYIDTFFYGQGINYTVSDFIKNAKLSLKNKI